MLNKIGQGGPVIICYLDGGGGVGGGSENYIFVTP